MPAKKSAQGPFPRPGFEYNDRFKMTVKEFGRIVIIEVNRGKVKFGPDGKTVVITYRDSPTRKASVKPKQPGLD
jgi:hypothetical protein